MHSRSILPMKLRFRQNLQSPKSSRATLLVKLSYENSQEIRYMPGEHVGLFAGNQPELVTSIIGLLKDAPPCNQHIRLETRNEQESFWTISEKIPPCSLTQALTYFLDITTPPTQLLLKKLSLLATDITDKSRLEELSKNSDEYNQWKNHNFPNFLEVLEEFPSLHVPTTFVLTQLPPLKPRYYSISSSNDMVPGEVHLTVAVVSYMTRGGQGPLHHGVCSTWLNTLKINETVPCFIRSTNTFHLPENPSLPCVLIGPGTGISPFRGFWQQRLYDLENKGIRPGSMILLFGCQQSGMDEIYVDETTHMKSKGILKDVYTAYSRQPGQAKVYVQDILIKNLESEVCRILLEEEGHLYVCGNFDMAKDVVQTLKHMIAKRLRLNDEETESYFSQLKNKLRYHEDTFGPVHKPQQSTNGNHSPVAFSTPDYTVHHRIKNME